MTKSLFYNFNILEKREYDNLNATIVAYKFLILAAISMIALLIAYFWIKKPNVKIENIHLVLVSVLGVAYMLLFLPHTIPDEPVHYFNAYNISNYFNFYY